jgi:hypothetical protein
MTIWSARIENIYTHKDVTQLFLKEPAYWPDISVSNDCKIDFEVGDMIQMETENIRYISISVPGKGIYKWQHTYR